MPLVQGPLLSPTPQEEYLFRTGGGLAAPSTVTEGVYLGRLEERVRASMGAEGSVWPWLLVAGAAYLFLGRRR